VFAELTTPSSWYDFNLGWPDRRPLPGQIIEDNPRFELPVTQESDIRAKCIETFALYRGQTLVNRCPITGRLLQALTHV